MCREAPDGQGGRGGRDDAGGADGEADRDPTDGRSGDDPNGVGATGGEDDPPTGRQSPVGAPVVRGDRSVAGDRAPDAVGFDPDDPADLERAARTVTALAESEAEADDLFVLRGAAAAAALVRGEGSYRGAADRADVSVSFVRKWARVHDLPRSIRRQVAVGRLAPSAAKHVARLRGEPRLLVAWAAIDAGLTVAEVRTVVGAVADGTDVETALSKVDATLGRVTVDLPPATYRELRRAAALSDDPPDSVVARALDRYLETDADSGREE